MMNEYSLRELEDLFVDGRVCIGLSMIPKEEGSLIGVLNIHGEIF